MRVKGSGVDVLVVDDPVPDRPFFALAENARKREEAEPHVFRDLVTHGFGRLASNSLRQLPDPHVLDLEER